MATRIAVLTQNAAADAITARLNGGTVKLYTGSPPPSADDAATGTLLVTITLSNPAFGAAAAGIADVDITPALTAAAVASGTAGWFRGLSSGGAKVIDGKCSASGGSGDMLLTNVSITSGQNVTIESWSIEMPGT